MRTKLHKSKEEERAAIEKEIAAISVDLERLRTIIQRATEGPGDQPVSVMSQEHHNNLVVK
jgi:hypothetical protein